VEAAREAPIDGVLAVGDRPTVTAALVAKALGLPGHPPDAAAAARSKRLTRERLKDAGLPVPWFTVTDIAHPPRHPVTFPCVVKPLALSGSRGVIRANDETELAAAFARLGAILAAPDVQAEHHPDHSLALVEGFIPGWEYAVEGILTDGVLQLLAIFDKPDPLNGPFFEETIYVTPSKSSTAVQAGIEAAIRAAVRALGLHHGPIHAECRVNEQGVHVLEVAARPIGGLCAKALAFSRRGTTITLEELLLRHSVNEPQEAWRREAAASGVMMLPIPKRGVLRGVSGVDDARAIPGIVDIRITAKVDQVLVPLPEGSSYLGFVFARGADPSGVERALRDAHRALSFVIQPEVRVLQSLHG
jgi:biotin carboxylase